MQIHGPERLAGQGLDCQQEESGNRAIAALLSDAEARDYVDLVITWRGDAAEQGAYEVWARRGMVRFQRLIDDQGRLDYQVLEVRGENPIANQDPHALRSVDAEREGARASGFAADPPERRFVRPEQQSYPFGYERIAQLFDSPNAPDLAVSPNDWCQGVQRGQHGALHVRQARAPLWFIGRGVKPGIYDLAARAVDIAPTVLAALDFPKIDGADATGRRSSERGVAPDVYLARQDGRVLEEILESGGKTPKRLYILLLDGLHHTELEERLESDLESLPNLRRLRERAAVLTSGSMVNFPSITWPSHTTIVSGAWCGHHDVVNPSYYLREKRETVSPQGQQVRTETFANPDVESLFEAFHRVQGEDTLTAGIYAPFGRSAKHAVLEGRNLCDRATLRSLNEELGADRDPRWADDGMEAVERESVLDMRGVAQVIELFTSEEREAPACVYHELALTDGAGHDYGPHGDGLRSALDESDRRIGRVLDLLEKQGLLEETLFVLSTDHGMAPQDVSLEANASRHVLEKGMAAVVAEPMIWLHDLAIEVERAADGRTARVFVHQNDRLPSGERPAVEGAEVRVQRGDEWIAGGRTGPGGVFGFATPSEVSSDELVLGVEADGFNPRHVRLDGSPVAVDLRDLLYS